jgi:protein-S-isoprenylcysteine O-methyltransferase Ste14
MSDGQRAAAAVLRRGIRSLAIFFVVLGLLVFLPAGDIRWAKGWLFILVFFVLTVPAVIYLWRVNPEIFAARSRVFRPGTKRWDKVLVRLLVLSFTAMFSVAAFDSGRFHWSGVPLWLIVLGYVLLCIGYFISVWAESVNKFAEPTVRIQTERGHKVIDTGPYAIVRHPLYSGGLFMFAGIPLTLGSFWALIPAAAATLVLVVRTILEDKTLQNELEGYKAYAARVRHRLIPGLW